MTYSKEFTKNFYHRLSFNLNKGLRAKGLKFIDKSIQGNFYTFINSCLKEALDTTFIELKSFLDEKKD